MLIRDSMFQFHISDIVDILKSCDRYKDTCYKYIFTYLLYCDIFNFEIADYTDY